MKFEIKNRLTGKSQFIAEISAGDDESYSIKLGMAIKIAISAGANLTDANLTWANLTWANLTDANLTGANLDFSSGIPFHCGGTNYKGDDRLFAQMLFHITRGNWGNASGGVREAVAHIRAMAVADYFCEFRTDVKKLK